MVALHLNQSHSTTPVPQPQKAHNLYQVVETASLTHYPKLRTFDAFASNLTHKNGECLQNRPHSPIKNRK